MTPGKVSRTAILGTGFIAEWHMKALRALPNARVVAVCDLDPARARTFATKHRIDAVFSSVSELIASKCCDVVHVLTPAEAHYRTAREVIESGLHAYVEKLLCLTSEECSALAELAESQRVQIGVGHNFLFSEVYERLRQDVIRGTLGRVDRIDIQWNKELGVVSNGPFDHWMLRSPQNIILEIGPHSVSQMLDLAGMPDDLTVRASNPVELPSSVAFYRRWQVQASRGGMAIDLGFSFVPGYAEHTIHVRGRLAAATVDFERNLNVLQKHRSQDYDFDRYAMAIAEAASTRKQARSTLRDVVLSKLTKSPRGNPFGASVARGVAAFHAGIREARIDPRLSARMGRDTVALCLRIGEAAAVRDRLIASSGARDVASVSIESSPRVLILGATGFIGRELVRQFAEKHIPVRVLVRNTGGVCTSFDRRYVEVMKGDLTRAGDVDRALDGITHVYHLARARAKTYSEFLKNDLEVTRALAEKCLERRIARLIFTSSISPYYSGKKAGRITEETPLDPRIDRRNPYARVKAQTECVLLEMHSERNLPVVIFRPGIVIARGSRPFHPGVGQWAWDSICRFWGEGQNPLPIVLVEDVASALVAAFDTPRIEGESFNLVGDPCLNAREFVSAIEKTAGIRIDAGPAAISRFYVSDLGKWIVKLLVRHPERRLPSYRDWDSRSQRAHYDCSKAKRMLGWKPTADPAEVVRRGIQEPLSELLR
ncbi:MAG: NAD-dependent epimerase/dehydratase family protein [Isosphaeraceae bacterium]|nr:NAD-dependent epimerase/dehydratase family protein [Isosphaeraceae bacterium]